MYASHSGNVSILKGTYIISAARALKVETNAHCLHVIDTTSGVFPVPVNFPLSLTGSIATNCGWTSQFLPPQREQIIPNGNFVCTH